MTDHSLEAVRSLVRFMKTLKMYPEDHPRLKERMKITREHFDEVFSSEGRLIVGVDSNQLLVQNSAVDESDEQLMTFKSLLKDRNIGSLVFLEDVSGYEVISFVELLADPPGEVMKDNRIDPDRLDAFQHIKIDSVSVEVSLDESDVELDEERESGQEASEEEEDEEGVRVASLLVRQLDRLSEYIDGEEFVNQLPDELRSELDSSFSQFGFVILARLFNQLASYVEEKGKSLSSDSVSQLFDALIGKMTETQEMGYSEFVRGLEETATEMDAGSAGLASGENGDEDGVDSQSLMRRINPDTRGKVISQEMKTVDSPSEDLREVVDSITYSGEDIMQVTEGVMNDLVKPRRTGGPETQELSSLFDALIGEANVPGREGTALVVDPDLELLDEYRDLLSRIGMEVETFQDGQAAWEELQSEQAASDYDVLVLEIRLPGRNGLDLLEYLNARRIDLPVVVVTEDREFNDSFEIITYDELTYLTKPIDRTAFLEAIDRYVPATTTDEEEMEKVRESDRKKAREIQERLIDREIGDIGTCNVHTYYSPSRYVGGDYLDHIQIDDNRHVLLLGDVTGKGVPAAMIMVMVRSVIHTCFNQVDDPKQALVRANELIAKDIREGMFISLMLVLVNTEEHSIRLMNAGHMDPVIWRVSTGRAHLYETGGMAVGLTRRDVFGKTLETRDIDFSPGDTMIIYTDGVVEAMNEEDEPFGTERLLDIAENHGGNDPKTLTRELVKQIKLHEGDAPQHDDLTVLTIQAGTGESS